MALLRNPIQDSWDLELARDPPCRPLSIPFPSSCPLQAEKKKRYLGTLQRYPGTSNISVSLRLPQLPHTHSKRYLIPSKVRGYGIVGSKWLLPTARIAGLSQLALAVPLCPGTGFSFFFFFSLRLRIIPFFQNLFLLWHFFRIIPPMVSSAPQYSVLRTPVLSSPWTIPSCLPGPWLE